MNGGENQVAGQRRLDGDLRRFLVADFTHHDFVWVVAQDGTQAAGKGQALLLIHRDLGDAPNLVLDWVLDGDDFVLVGFDFRQRRIKGGGLAAARRPGDQHHAVGLANKAAQALELARRQSQHVEAQLTKLFAERLLVQDSQHGVFAVNGRHDGNAEINGAAAVADTEAAVLGDAPLGDVELRHNFDACDEVRLEFPRQRRHGFLQHTVNAILHGDGVVAAFDMDIARPPLEPGEDERVHEPNHGGPVLFLDEGFERQALASPLLVTDHVQTELLGGLFEHALRGLGLLQELAHLAARRHLEDQPALQPNLQLVEAGQVRRVADRHDQLVVSGLEREEFIVHHQFQGDRAQQLRIRAAIAQVHEIELVPIREFFGVLQFSVQRSQHIHAKTSSCLFDFTRPRAVASPGLGARFLRPAKPHGPSLPPRPSRLRAGRDSVLLHLRRQ